MQQERYPEWLMARFWAKVDTNGPGGCWQWTASLTGGGYGQFYDAVIRKRRDAHRFSYEVHVGPIPVGLELDHLCRVRECVNPAHLEPVTRAENLRRGVGFGGVNARKTHCINGHEFTVDNIYVPPKRPNTRQCRACRDDRVRLALERPAKVVRLDERRGA